MKNTLRGLALLVATATGCATTTAPEPVPEVAVQRRPGITARATMVSDYIGSYMLVDQRGVPYALLKLKCGECPVSWGFVSVYEGEGHAKGEAANLQSVGVEHYTPVEITPDTILEYVLTRYTSGRRIDEREQETPSLIDLKPL